MQYQRQINQENIETTICHSQSLFRISYNDPRKDANSIQHREAPMAYSESYSCDVCGDKKTVGGDWWLAWVDCFHGDTPGEEQPLIQLTRWQLKQAHVKGVKHLCGARCAGTMIDRWMSNQHENPESACEAP